MKLISLDKQWYVVRTYSRQERETGLKLHEAGYEVYVPTKRVDKIHHRTKAVIVKEEPLWPGYLFASLPRWDKKLSRETFDFKAMKDADGVIELLRPSAAENPVRVPSRFVEGIQIAEMDMQFDETLVAQVHRGEVEKTQELELRKRFRKGSRVNVLEGPFANFQGIVEKVIDGRLTIKAVVEIFGRGVAVEFSPKDLEPVRPAA